MANNSDYYSILGVSKSATPDEIKRAYRKLAMQYHPDRNKTKEAEQKFKEIGKAYEVLSDPQKKQMYDQVGHAAYENGGGNPFGGGGPFGGQSGQYGPFSYTYTSGGGGFEGVDPFDIFEQFFGGASPFGRRKPSYSLTIDFMEAVKGVEKSVSLNGKNQKIKIPAGVNDGSRIRFSDYDVVVRVRPSKEFAREGNDIVTEHNLSISQAALGDTVDVRTIDGSVKLRIPAGTQPETLFRLRGKGVPSVRGGGRGDHYVKIKVVIPKNLTSRQKELLKEFEEAGNKKSWF